MNAGSVEAQPCSGCEQLTSIMVNSQLVGRRKFEFAKKERLYVTAAAKHSCEQTLQLKLTLKLSPLQHCDL